MRFPTMWYVLPAKAQISVLGCIAQSVMCLATDVCLTADPGVLSLIPVRSHTFMEIDQ